MQRLATPMRVWFILLGILLWLGIYLTGFSNVHWLLYVPAALFVLAGLIGICPSMILVNKMFGAKKS